ncbi:MAG: DedA family protein [Gammaproteobacteria bacterium]|nr:DedA family protein [Gammaproteobacteria bacterium]
MSLIESLDLNLVIDWVAARPALAAAILFVVTFAESLALVGLFVPGVLFMWLAGALIALGILDPAPILVSAVAGAFAGDGVSYAIGRRLKGRARVIWPFSRHPEWWLRSESFFRRHGVFSVVLGRFVGPVRPVIPLVVGVLGMRSSLFYLTNGVSALAWAPLYLLPGFLVGSSLAEAPIIGAKLTLAVFALGLLCWGLWQRVRGRNRCLKR